MPFRLNSIVPFGRSFDEYVKMFDLDDKVLGMDIIGVADGPASFNARLSKKGGNVVSVDPMYGFPKIDLQRRIDETFDQVINETYNNMDEFNWDHIGSIDELRKTRREAMDEFLADYDKGKREGRYIDGELPEFLFEADRFDLALCSHFLFLYSEHLTVQFHLKSVKEMCRIAREVRIFPVPKHGSKRSRHLDKVINELRNSGYVVRKTEVDYEFQKCGNQMLKVGNE